MRAAFYISIAAVLLLSCEQELIEPQWPEYEEKLVLEIEFDHWLGKEYRLSGYISRTQSLKTQIEQGSFRIPDANIDWRIDGVQSSVHLYQTGYGTLIGGDTTIIGDLEDVYIAVSSGNKTAYVRESFVEDRIHLLSTQILKSVNDTTLEVTFNAPDQYGYRVFIEVSYYVGDWYNTVERVTYPGYEDSLLLRNSDGSKSIQAELANYWAVDTFRITFTQLGEGYYWREMDKRQRYYDTDFGIYALEEENRHFNIKGDGIGYFWYSVPQAPIYIPVER